MLPPSALQMYVQSVRGGAAWELQEMVSGAVAVPQGPDPGALAVGVADATATQSVFSEAPKAT